MDAEENNNKRRRKSRLSPSRAGEILVIGELLRRGFDAKLGPNKHEILVRAGDSLPKPIQVKVVLATPWYVRRASFVGDVADQITVLVLLGVERTTKSARFFVAKNSDLTARFRWPSTWREYAFIDAKSVESYEGNWDILR
jgi:hypothetical protein